MRFIKNLVLISHFIRDIVIQNFRLFTDLVEVEILEFTKFEDNRMNISHFMSFIVQKVGEVPERGIDIYHLHTKSCVSRNIGICEI